jgi:hypothetical protein
LSEPVADLTEVDHVVNAEQRLLAQSLGDGDDELVLELLPQPATRTAAAMTTETRAARSIRLPGWDPERPRSSPSPDEAV